VGVLFSVLKHFSDVGCGPIIAVHGSNDVPGSPPTPECQKRVKWGLASVTCPRKICELNANSPVKAKATDFKFGVRALVDHPDMASVKISKKGGVARVT